MFTVGEKVVYPVHGAGIIESIEQRDILGESRSYFVLRLATGDLQVLIPVDAVGTTGMRTICTISEIEDVKKILAGESSFWEDNWNRRYRLNMDKIKTGEINEIAEVVRNLTLRDMEKGVSAGEKKMLDNAKKILISEIVLASSITTEEAASALQEIFVKKED